MLDYRYKTFLTLIEEGSYTKAAKKLNITQPAVTQHIQHLQEELGGDDCTCPGSREQETAFDPGDALPEKKGHDEGGDAQPDRGKPQGPHLLEKEIAHRVPGPPEEGHEKHHAVG